VYTKPPALCLLAMLPVVAAADYAATGVIEGEVCHGFVLESCRMVPILAVKGKDGRLYTMTAHFAKVDDYNAGQHRCWIRTKSTGGGLLSWATNAALQPEFYTRNDGGQFEEVDVEYLTFPCAEL
jgi:hypothetical protein